MTFIIIVFVYGIMHSTLFKENMMWQTFNLDLFIYFYITLMESLNIEYNAQNLIKNIILR